jgi:TfoX/Sxy family transcriptional regulator of competence genes
MAFDENLAERMRQQLASVPGVVEKRMFGGTAFLLNGNLCVGVHKDALMVRLGSDATEAALRKPHTRVFDLTGKPMKNWVLVDPAGVKTTAALKKWVGLGVKFAGSLPPK